MLLSREVGETKRQKVISGTGNRTQGCSVRASDVSHYTIPDVISWCGLMEDYVPNQTEQG